LIGVGGGNYQRMGNNDGSFNNFTYTIKNDNVKAEYKYNIQKIL